ncbi:MAG TPA: hypothetical protein VJ204_04700 [Solirubrobacterales bacterium]|nr:hypothetical protein [Solirubrobacterales bacterium]
MSAAGAGVRRAAALGTVTGARTFLAPAALALRGRLGKVAKFAVPPLALGELVGDKLPTAPPRVQGPGLVGRVVSGAISGRVSGGSPGLRVGAAFALAATYPSQTLRGAIVKHTPIPDIACAVPEDLLATTVAFLTSTEPRPDPFPPDVEVPSHPHVDGPKTGDIGRFSAHQHGASRGIVSAAGCGLAAAAVGTAAMTSAQVWLYGFTGGQESEAPAKVGEKILGALGVKVRKEQRPALGTAMHALYGTSWGLPFGVLFGRGGPTGPTKGLVFGLNVWLASLVELPALGVAPPPWKQPPAALAQDLAFHLVYGTATAAAYEAFTA